MVHIAKKKLKKTSLKNSKKMKIAKRAGAFEF